jgi:hypothetical protein
MQIVTAGTVAGAITIVAAMVSCSAPATRLPIATFDGQYVGKPIPTNVGFLNGVPCPTNLAPVTIIVANQNVTLLFNPNTHLIFSGPASDDGAVAISGRNDQGSRGMSLVGVIANGQFDGRTGGLTCNAEMHLKRI